MALMFCGTGLPPEPGEAVVMGQDLSAWQDPCTTSHEHFDAEQFTLMPSGTWLLTGEMRYSPGRVERIEYDPDDPGARTLEVSVYDPPAGIYIIS